MKPLIVFLSFIIFCSAVLPKQDDELEKSIARGKGIYAENCMSCHMGDGEGVPQTFPPLAKADYLSQTPEKAMHAIKYGLQGKILVNNLEFDNQMPSPGLDNAEIADVMNYILNSWGNSSGKKMVTDKMVEAIKK
ncbi:cytochrome c [Dyadobacter sp. CY356]|uniref:c-type cytochrome n=1 Tax=Dyadobacter sp. CY356 TaxID=2906442 RepID=UPI001F47FD04|nr:cytochrome c [Dyadobacter sp. CY356]MCF0054216.1 cytochrome c [Dyadobacter sp. CY356]